MLVPIGRKILAEHFRADYGWASNEPRNYRASLGAGVTKDLEVEFYLSRLEPDGVFGTFDVSYNALSPLMDYAPGISLGMLDVMDRTTLGRTGYLAVTWALGLDGSYNRQTPLDITIGVRVGRDSKGFVAASVPFTWAFRLMAEHDGFNPRVGLEFQPRRGLPLRWMTDPSGPSWGVRWSGRF